MRIGIGIGLDRMRDIPRGYAVLVVGGAAVVDDAGRVYVVPVGTEI